MSYARSLSNEPFEVRFREAYIPEPNSGCWLWLNSTATGGYGRIEYNGQKSMRAHRASWSYHNGKPVPAGMVVMHKCDVPSCVNPDHLTIGTCQENNADKQRKGRQARGQALSHPRASGEANGNSRITRADADFIKDSTLPQRVLAAQFGVSQTAIWAIKQGKMWK